MSVKVSPLGSQPKPSEGRKASNNSDLRKLTKVMGRGERRIKTKP